MRYECLCDCGKLTESTAGNRTPLSKHIAYENMEKVNCCGSGRTRTDDPWNQNPLFYHPKHIIVGFLIGLAFGITGAFVAATTAEVKDWLIGQRYIHGARI